MVVMKHKSGRPSKYNENVLFLIEEYLNTCGKEQMELPTIEGLAIYLGVNTDTIVEWGKKHKKFSATVKKLVERQKNQLMNDGLYGGKEVNQAMAIFLLKVNHGMIETSHTDITTAGKPLPQPLIDVRKNNSNRETAGTDKKD